MPKDQPRHNLLTTFSTEMFLQNCSSMLPAAVSDDRKSQSSGSNGSNERPRRHYSKRNKRFMHPCGRTIQVIENIPKGTVNHSYQDLSSVPPESDYEFPASIKEMSFSEKIHYILNQEIYSNYISWLPHGRAFVILVPLSFENEVLPVYFGHKRYSTFLRHLNNHGFKHLTKGRDRNSYYHECMLRGLPYLSRHMPLPRDTRRFSDDPENEPDFYGISQAFPLPEGPADPTPASHVCSDMTFQEFNLAPTPLSQGFSMHPGPCNFTLRMEEIASESAAAFSSRPCNLFPNQFNDSVDFDQQWNICEPTSIEQNSMEQKMMPQNSIEQNLIKEIPVQQTQMQQNFIQQIQMQQNFIQQTPLQQNSIPQNSMQQNSIQQTSMRQPPLQQTSMPQPPMQQNSMQQFSMQQTSFPYCFGNANDPQRMSQSIPPLNNVFSDTFDEILQDNSCSDLYGPLYSGAQYFARSDVK